VIYVLCTLQIAGVACGLPAGELRGGMTDLFNLGGKKISKNSKLPAPGWPVL
jgi:hypothetical protein